MDNQFWQEYRAALIQRAKALETERACVLRIIKAIEKQGVEGIETIILLEKDNIARVYNVGIEVKP